MKRSKIIARMLVVLGFGGAAGLAACGTRAQKSRPADTNPVADTVVMPDGGEPVRVMYGVPPARFDANKPIPERAQPSGDEDR